MLDYIRNAMVQLMSCNYDLFLPMQRPLCDDIVVSDGYTLRRLLIRNVSTTQNGPVLNMKIERNRRTVLIEELGIDGVLASWPLNKDVWIIPIEACSMSQTIRLANRPDWLVTPLARLDEPQTMTDEAAKQVKKGIREAVKFEASIADEAAKENEYFNALLKDGFNGQYSNS